MVPRTMFLLGATLSFVASACAEVKLPSIFSNHMILQKADKVPFWGKAEPGEKVKVNVAGAIAEAQAGEDGKWKVVLNLSTAAEGPHTAMVEGKNRIEITDVLIGEVWLFGGQSNAGMPMYWDSTSKEEIPRSRNNFLRTYQMDSGATAFDAQEDQPAGRWIVADPTTSGTFWAPGYFFAKALQQSLKVPVGYIAVAKGNTSAEVWMSDQALSSDPYLKAYLDRTKGGFLNYDRLMEEYFQAYLSWQRKFGREDRKANPQVLRTEGVPQFRSAAASDPIAPQQYAAPGVDDKDWKKVMLPGMAAEMGLPESGTVWFRKTVTLPVASAGKDIGLGIPGMEAVVMYFNGQPVGYNHPHPVGGWGCTVPGKLVKEGANVVALRIFSPVGKLGASKDAGELRLGTLPLGGTWLAKMEFALPPMSDDVRAALDNVPQFPNRCDGGHVPGVSYNAVIHPLAPYAIRGFTWYQGETGGGYFYRKSFALLIEDWRALWKQENLPFYFCQLPNYQAKVNAPVEDGGWAVTRESQAEGLRLPNTGMAVLIDLGEANNLHPHRKKEVGERLAAIALAQTYGKKIPFVGPTFASMAIEGKAIRLRFTHTDGGLVAQPLPKEYPLDLGSNATAPLVIPNPESPLRGFAICGKNRAWVWAKARIDGDTVVLESPNVPEPVAVRYAWAENPTCNLYNGAGFPAAPFRTDTFPVFSQTFHPQ